MTNINSVVANSWKRDFSCNAIRHMALVRASSTVMSRSQSSSASHCSDIGSARFLPGISLSDPTSEVKTPPVASFVAFQSATSSTLTVTIR